MPKVTVRRHVLLLARLLLTIPAFHSAMAEDYPARPVHLLVGFAAGGGTDLMARFTAEPLAELLGQPIITENRPGAGGITAATVAKNAAPDGYTLLFGNQGMMSLVPAIYRDLPFSPVDDFMPVTSVGTLSNVIIVNASKPLKTIDDLVTLAKSQRLLASGATGTSQLLLEVFQGATKTKLEYVAYKSGVEAIRAVVSEGVTMTIIDLSSALPFIKKGEVRALAVTSAKRARFLPDVPTVSELGYPSLTASPWVGVLAPRGTPPAIVGKLNDSLLQVTQSRAYRDKMATISVEASGIGTQQFKPLLAQEVKYWADVAKAGNIKVDQ